MTGNCMTTFCQICREEIPEARRRKKSRTCNRECQKEYRRQYRLELNERVCRTCGRGKPKQKVIIAGDTVPGAVNQVLQGGSNGN